MCWYCHWGWPKPVADIYRKAVAELGSEQPMDYGPGHIVWSDSNLDDDSIRYCLEQVDQPLYNDLTPEEKAIVRRSLEELLAVPEEIRDCAPDVDDDNHAAYPPPPGIEMVHNPLAGLFSPMS